MNATTKKRAEAALAAGKRVDITFRAATRWSGREKHKRKLRGFDDQGRPLVYFGGWSDFVLRVNEVVEIEIL